jgi:hypothetical protein
MDRELLGDNDWVRAATLAHMLLSQSLSDDVVDNLCRAWVFRPLSVPVPVAAPRAA